MPITKTTRRTKNRLRCYRSDRERRTGYTLTASGAQQKLSRSGRVRLCAHIICSDGHEFWSTHPDALRLGREADALRRAGGAAATAVS